MDNSPMRNLIAKEQNGQTFFEAFVHFAHWFDTPSAHALQAQVLDPQVKAQLVHLQSKGGVGRTFIAHYKIPFGLTLVKASGQ